MLAIQNRGGLSEWRLTGWRLKRAVLRTLALVATTTLLCTPVAAQRFKSIKPKISVRASKALQADVASAMRSAAAFQASDAQTKIKKYFRTFYFPMMTQQSPTDLSRLGRLREDLFKRYLRPSPVQAAQDFLTKESLGIMRVLSRDNYHPAVRYNAVLILGMLDQQYAGTGADATPPVPLPAATNELLELLEQDKFKDVKVSPQVKVGAIEGLVRHARFGIDPQYTQRTTQAAMAVLAQETSSMDISDEVHHWMQCQAANVLIQLSKDAPNDAVQTALTKLIANEKVGLDDRCYVVGLLKKTDYSAAAGAGADVSATGVSAMVLPLGKLTQAVVEEGSEQANDYIELVIGKNPGRRSGGFGGGGGYGGGRRGEQGPKLERSQFLSRLKLITTGAKSLSEGLPEEEKQKILELVTPLLPIMKLSGNKKSIDVEIAEKIVELKEEVDTLIANWQPAAAAAEVEFAE